MKSEELDINVIYHSSPLGDLGVKKKIGRRSLDIVHSYK